MSNLHNPTVVWHNKKIGSTFFAVCRIRQSVQIVQIDFMGYLQSPTDISEHFVVRQT
jgi:hypothetical protein